jgi:hypothetical protein
MVAVGDQLRPGRCTGRRRRHQLDAHRVGANSFSTAGGDGFSAFLAGDDRVSGPVDVETSFAAFQKRSPVAPARGGPRHRHRRAVELLTEH